MNNSRLHRTVSGVPLSSAERRAIAEYLEMPTPETLVERMAPAKTVQAALGNLEEARKTIASQWKRMVEAMSNDVLFALLLALCQKYGVSEAPLLEVEFVDSELAENENTKPAWREWRARLDRGVASEAEKEAAELGEAIAQGKEILGERWIGGAVDAREWFALALGDDACSASDENGKQPRSP